MNYSIISSLGRVKGLVGKWESIDVSKFTVQSLYTRYDKIYVNVKNNYTKEEGTVLLDNYVNKIPNNKSFAQYIADDLGDTGLVYMDKTYTFNESGLIYRDALNSGFTIHPVKTGLKPDMSFQEKDAYTDLFFTKEGVDYKDMYHHVLVTVNGYIHASDASSTGFWVTDGYKTLRKRGRQCIGLISFENLGSIEQIPIKEEMIYQMNEEVPLYQEVFVKINQSTKGKSILLVLGGYLYLLDKNVFVQYNESVIKIKMKNIRLLNKIHQSEKDLEYPNDLYQTKISSSGLHVKHVQSDEFVKQYLTRTDSFVVLLDNDEIFIETKYPQKRRIPNNYLTEYKPTLPLKVGLGKFEEYVWVKDVDRYVLETADCQTENRHYDNIINNTVDTIYTRKRPSHNRFSIPDAYFFNIKSLVKKQ